MPTKRDYYEILGVARDAGEEDIRKAFHRLAFEYHPDRNDSHDAEERFKEINEAYEVLCDSQKRASYDRYGHAGIEGFSGRGFQGFDFGGFGDIFDAFFGGTTTTREAPRRGADLRCSLSITFEEAVFGTEKELEVLRTEVCSACQGMRCEPGSQPVQCPHCNGTGRVRRVQQSIFGQFVNVATCGKCGGEGKVVTQPCLQCRGTGRERRNRTILIKVPPGVDDGSQIRLSGEGEAGARGGPPGSIYISISVQEHKIFHRDGNDITLDLPISFAQAALGDDVEVPTVDDNASLKIPPGTQTDRLFVIKGKGVPHLRGGGRGDQLVRIRVVTPHTLDVRQKRLFQELARTLPKPPLSSQEKGFFDKLKDALGGTDETKRSR
ncbi:MAG: molecular chaperone DnaJ [Chloroflexota bacterium]